MLFGQTTLNLSGAINVLLFLIIQPQILHFATAPPELPVKPEAEISYPNTAPLPDTVRRDHRPGAVRTGQVDDSENRTCIFTFDRSRYSDVPSDVI
jgi:hypothetical protein